jgi:hypothetical protein
VPPAFFAETAGKVPAGGSNLPEAYVLAFDESTSARALLLAAWSWVESSLGDTYLLLFVAHDEGERKSVLDAAHQMGLGETVRAVVEPEQDWPAAFRRRRFHARRRPGMPRRCGRSPAIPVVDWPPPPGRSLTRRLPGLAGRARPRQPA